MSDNFKKGDLFTITRELQWDDGSPIDLTDVQQVIFVMRRDGGDEIIRGTCIIDDVEGGIVSYTLCDGESSVGGMYRNEYELHRPSIGTEASRVYTVPNHGTYWIHIEEDVA